MGIKDKYTEIAGNTLDKALKSNFRGDSKDLLRAIGRGNGQAEEWTAEDDSEPEEDEEVADDAPIEVKMKNGVTLNEVHIMNEGNGLVFDIEASGEAGSSVVQYEFHGGENQLWNITYDNA